MSARRHSLGDRITLLVILASAIAIVLVTAVLAAANHRQIKQITFDALKAQAEIAAINSAAPLGFGDNATATEVLDGLGMIADVTEATLFKTNGERFAQYLETPRTPGMPVGPMRKAGTDSEWGTYVVLHPVGERGDQLGTLQVVYDLGTLRAELMRNLLIAGGIGLLGLSLSALFARKGARILVRRLTLLDETAQRVSASRDYSVRATVVGEDEIAGFTRTFNEMLARIEEQDEALRASRQDALAASRLKDEFLATVSHELRTPMTPISGWAQMLPRLAPENPRVVEAAQVIGRNATTMSRIIEDLLDMSRIISGKVRLDAATFAMDDLVADAIESVRLAAEAKDIAISTRIEPGLQFRGDQHRLQQVLWNLLSNSVKFTPAGGAVEVVARRQDASIRVEVSDTGLGIEPEFLPHAFDRFRQADSSVTRPYGGLGLGLAIARQLVELHGGEIDVHSRGIGHGCCFGFTLPLSAQLQPPDPRTTASTSTPPVASVRDGACLSGTRVLLVEDEPDARELIRQVLVEQGADVGCASSAAEALERIAVACPDILVSDIGMAVHDGYWLIGQVRQHADDAVRGLPAIALTAFAGEQDRLRATQAGYDAHLAKPVDHPQLVSTVHRLRRPGVYDGG